MLEVAEVLFALTGMVTVVFAKSSSWQWLDEEEEDEIPVPKGNATLLRAYVDTLLEDADLQKGFEKKRPKFKAVYDLSVPLDEEEEEDAYWDDYGMDMGDERRVRRTAPKEARYFDAVKIHVKAGNGGDGCVAFETLRKGQKKTATGGSGGKGGSIYLRVNEAENTLRSFRSSVHFVAERGTHGQGKHRNGECGGDVYVDVPPGTLVYAADQYHPDQRGEMLGDLVENGDTMLVAKGGDGGLGNHVLKPVKGIFTEYAEAGEKGKEQWLLLELKLVADVGIVGVPSAGKSTLLNAMTDGRAQTKVGAYPFTTLAPNLGVCRHDYKSIVVADIPGLLEGAHQGKGLGIEFLRHVERCRVIIHLLSGDRPDPLYDYQAIQQELELFSPGMLAKPQIVVYNKMDLPEAQDKWPEIKAHFENLGMPVMSLTAAQGRSSDTNTLIQRMIEEDTKERNREKIQEEIAEAQGKVSKKQQQKKRTQTTVVPTYQIDQLDSKIYKDDHSTIQWFSCCQISSPKIEKLAQMTKWEYRDAVERFETVMRAMGIYKALKKAGVKEGDLVMVTTFCPDHSFYE
eukprot:jgi/Bigna1/67460/fgenesh1_pg.3_\